MNEDSTTCYQGIASPFSYRHLDHLNSTKLSLPDTSLLPWHLMNEGSTTYYQGISNLFALQQLLDLDSTKLSYHWSSHALAPQPLNCRYEHRSHHSFVNNTSVPHHKSNQFLKCDSYLIFKIIDSFLCWAIILFPMVFVGIGSCFCF